MDISKHMKSHWEMFSKKHYKLKVDEDSRVDVVCSEEEGCTVTFTIFEKHRVVVEGVGVGYAIECGELEERRYKEGLEKNFVTLGDGIKKLFPEFLQE